MTFADELPPASVRAHDLARQVPEELWTEALDGLLGHLQPGGRCVDVGIGTGAVGGRLLRQGVDVVGVDLNATMLAALAASHPDLPVVRGDATALPLPGGCAGLTVLACVVHLLDDWRGGLAEAVRVTRPGGVVAVNVGQSGLAGRTGISSYFLERLTETIELPPMPGPGSAEDVRETMLDLGCEPMDPILVRGTAMRSVGDHIFRLEWNPFAWPPGTPQSRLSMAAAATRAWASERGDLEERHESPVSIGFQLFSRRGAP